MFLKSIRLVSLILITSGIMLSTSCRKYQPSQPDASSNPTPKPTNSVQPNPSVNPNPSANPNTPPDNPNPPNPNDPPVYKKYGVYFNNDYKGTVAENEPIAKADPNNPDKVFVRIIESAKTSVDGAFYDIGDMNITQAFIRAAKRGVKVRLVTETVNMTSGSGVRDTIKALQDAGIPIKDDKRSPLMHNKFMVVDNRITWTGSMNLTANSLFDHNNSSIMFESADLASDFEAEFKRMFEKQIFDGSDHSVPFPTVTIDGAIAVRAYFSPKGGTKEAIESELRKAQKSIKFMAFSYTDKDMAQDMIERKQANVNVQGVYDSCEISQYATYPELKNAGIPVYRDGNQALMHEKNIVIDDNTVITGSFNFSKNADQKNNENCLIIKSTEIAKLFNDEYERLKYASQHNTNLPPYNHPACGGGGGNKDSLAL